MSKPTLHLLCGKMASGKSTLAAKLSSAPDALMISEDTWLNALFGDRMETGSDYLKCSAKLQGIMGPHVIDVLATGASVVLDFPANTVSQRQWMREVIANSDAAHTLHFLDVSDDVCLERLRARNAAGDHPFAPTEAMFRRFAKHFEPPKPEEGFNVMRH